MTDERTQPQLSPVLVQLLKGVLYRDQFPKLWQDLIRLDGPIRDYVSVIGLELTLDEPEGYAFLAQSKSELPEGEEAVPRLVNYRQLSYPVSLLCVLLRKKLVEADAGGAETRVILTRAQIVEMMRVFLPHQANEARIVEQIDTHLSKVKEFGFLRELKGQEGAYEVRRILKAFVDADWLVVLDEKLRVYREYAERDA
jgi:hypothetical protein